jgi:hypothetical protein
MGVRTVVMTVIIGIGSALCSQGFAQSLAEKKLWEGETGKMKGWTEKVKKACGVEIPVTFDEATFTDQKETASRVCWRPFYTLEDMCKRDKDFKKAISEKVKGVACKYKKDAGAAPELAFDNGSFAYAGDSGKGGIDQAIRTFLMNKL